MPDPIGAFLTLAEVGIGLAGFAGIVLALTRRDAPLSSAHAVLVRELILNSLAVDLLALLPVGLMLLEIQSSSIWRGSSAFHAALIFFVAWPSLVAQVRALPADERDPVTYLVIVALGSAALLLQCLNWSGIVFEPSGGAYFFGVCVGPLAIGAIYFGRVPLFAPTVVRPPSKVLQGAGSPHSRLEPLVVCKGFGRLSAGSKAAAGH